jgi:hypothetical protein
MNTGSWKNEQEALRDRMAGEIREGAMSCNGKRMPLIITGALLLLCAAAGRAQSVIENPAKPKGANAGRVLKLAEVWRITDEGGEFFFKYPHNLQIAEDGTIFLAEAEQFLKFAADGTFVRNLYKKGQGPGEIGREFDYFVRGQDLFIQDMNSQRFWRADLNGIFQEQITLANKDYRGFEGVLPDGFLFLKSVWPPFEERTGKLLEILETVVLVARDGTERRAVATFRPKEFLAPQAGMSWDPSVTKPSPDGKLLYAVHSRDYLIEVVDLLSGATVRTFMRAYHKVRHVESAWEPDFRKKNGSPKIEFEPDVDDIHPVGKRLWVVTSTDDKAKGRLIDVFDDDGRFVDNFYLGAGRSLMAVREDAVFCQEKAEDETIRIVKYRIEK